MRDSLTRTSPDISLDGSTWKIVNVRFSVDSSSDQSFVTHQRALLHMKYSIIWAELSNNDWRHSRRGFDKVWEWAVLRLGAVHAFAPVLRLVMLWVDSWVTTFQSDSHSLSTFSFTCIRDTQDIMHSTAGAYDAFFRRRFVYQKKSGNKVFGLNR